MGEYMTLLGTEEVSRAGHNMQDAAQRIERAMAAYDETNRMMAARLEELTIAVALLTERLDGGKEKA